MRLFKRLAKQAAPAGAALALVGVMVVPSLDSGATTGGVANLRYKATLTPLSVVGTVTLTAIAGADATSHSAFAGPGATTSTTEAMVHPGRVSPLGRPGYGRSRSGRTGRSDPAASGSSFAPLSNAVAGHSHLTTDTSTSLIGFTGISGPAQAATGAFGDLEPPDQGTCAGPATTGKPLVVEVVNTAFAGFTKTGGVVYPVTGDFRLFDQSSTAFLSDPRCYYDSATQRWFFTDLELGTPTGSTPSLELVAVSKSPNPFGAYRVFSVTTSDFSNIGGGCPCFGDFDMIGADANGFYITTNEFDVTGPHFNGTVLYAMSKQGLESAADGSALPTVARYAVTRDAFSAGRNTGPYHLSPASTPPGGSFAPNTEFFVESNSATAATNGTTKLLVYALTGTNVLATGGIPPLVDTEVTSEHYAFPPDALQKAGPLVPFTQFGPPLTTCNSCNNSTGMPELEADFDAVQEVTYTDGTLYGEIDTGTASGKDAVDWFEMAAAPAGSGTVSAKVTHQGYVRSSQSLLYPDVVVNASGTGYVGFTLSGPTTYPSAAYVPFRGATGPSGALTVAAAGAAPEDGFTCGTPLTFGCRWGDYSGGAVWHGRAYLMTEFIPSTPRDVLTNWGTFIWSLPAG